MLVRIQKSPDKDEFGRKGLFGGGLNFICNEKSPISMLSLGLIVSSCDKETAEVLESPMPQEMLNSGDIASTSVDPVIIQFSEYGEVVLATQQWIDDNATYPELADVSNVYLLNQGIHGLVQIYVYEDEQDLTFGLSGYDWLWEEKPNGDGKYVTCEKDGTNCAEGEVNHRCILIKKADIVD
ncbi:MAG: hypothetical protein LAT81_16320 [Oceanicaulis sp.]|nr:hypothetical protein [Oceanicaulis sp.]